MGKNSVIWTTSGERIAALSSETTWLPLNVGNEVYHEATHYEVIRKMYRTEENRMCYIVKEIK